MSLRNIVMAAAGAAGGIDIESAFAVSTYSGNNASRTITNGLNMSGLDSALWIATRSGTSTWTVIDSIQTNGAVTAIEFDSGGRASTGFNLAADNLNSTGDTYVAWSFVETPGFFSKATYTGNGNTTTGQSVAHQLGAAPGMVVVKGDSNGSNWTVYHRSLTNADASGMRFNTTGQRFEAEAGNWNLTSSSMQPGFDFTFDVNTGGVSYRAYFFAHNPDGASQCSTFTTDGSGNGSFNHGWAEGVQFVLLKSASATGDWEVFDTTRTPAWSGADARIRINTANREDTASRLSESGTTLSFAGLSASTQYVFLIIRAPA